MSPNISSFIDQVFYNNIFSESVFNSPEEEMNYKIDQAARSILNSVSVTKPKAKSSTIYNLIEKIKNLCQ